MKGIIQNINIFEVIDVLKTQAYVWDWALTLEHTNTFYNGFQ